MKQKIIPLPAATRERLMALIQTQQMAQAQIEAILGTAKEVMNVPADYTIRNVNIGFEPPVKEEVAAA